MYTGRHFDDYVTATQVGPPDVIRPALLILYSPACENNIWFLKEKMLPPEKYFVLAKHDYETFPKHIWYKLDKRDNLSQRYKPRNCPEFLFFKKGSSTLSPERHDQKIDKSVLAWIWERLRVYFVVTNNRKEDIAVYFDQIAEHEKQATIFVRPGETKSVHAHISDLIYITIGIQTLYVSVIEADFPRYLAITEETKFEGDLVTWLKETKRSIASQSNDRLDWRRSITGLYLLNFKQPVVLPRFTTRGYKKGIIPKGLYQDIMDFYKSNIKNRQAEKHDVEPAINDKEVKCSMVYLSDEMIKQISESMLPLMEEWSNCSLIQTRLYGIREYYTGNILRNHVDRVNTHIVSVILQVDKQLGGQPDWPLEVIDMNGKIQQVYLNPGEMLFYESATLIHGRPSPFKGNLFANAFLHYRPSATWGWDIVGRHLMYNGEILDDVSRMTAVNTEKAKSFHHHNIPIPRDEL